MDAAAATRTELYNAAKALGLPVTSHIRKHELVDLLTQAADGAVSHAATAEDDSGLPDGQPSIASRMGAFRRLAEARAAGEMVTLPRTLSGNDRRIHVRQTIREDHQLRISRQHEEALEKFVKLAESLFSFFRGTALLFYRDMAGEDSWMPTVLASGDVHPDNFGVMPNADNMPIFGINDYDEVFYAPFTWDLKRGATGFVIAAREVGGFGRKKRHKIAAAFVRGYVDRINAYASDHTESLTDMGRDNAPEMIVNLIDDATSGGRAEWLAKKYYDEPKRGFKSSKKLVPVSDRRQEFQELVDRYVRESDISVPERAGSMRVKDVAERRGQGTASLGLVRYYVMIEGPRRDATDDLLLEFKQARRSALDGLVPPSEHLIDGDADRVVHGHRVQLVSGDVFYGSVEHQDISFLVRERSWFRDDIDLEDLSFGGWRDYAWLCGGIVAQAHARSDETGLLDHDVEPDIVAAIGVEDLFVEDVIRFAEEAADRCKRDHKGFQADHALGAFRSVDVVYR